MIDKPDTEGELALRAGWPAMFAGYLGQEERYHKCFSGDWYLTGDRARRDQDGYLWFVGRADDVIISAGYRIGPFEVESALLEHPAVLESAAVASPDADRGAVVKAFVVLRAGQAPSEALVHELQDHVKRTTIGRPSSTSRPSKTPTPFEKDPRTGGSSVPARLLAQ